MSPWMIILTIALYFGAMLVVSRLSGKGDFYGTRKSHWLPVTIAMIGACMSGVTFDVLVFPSGNFRRFI